VLTASGIGAARFGEVAYDDFVDLMEPELGQVTGALQMNYAPDGDSFVAADGPPYRFDHPASRTVCFQELLCVYFGGPSDQELAFVGYRQSQAAGTLGTASGVRIGSRLSDHRQTVTLDGQECGPARSGTADGVDLRIEVQQAGSDLLEIDGVVVQLRSGSAPTLDPTGC
jgi:hypothetical protein